MDGLLVNFWRAAAADAAALARWADWPVTEIDLTARHMVLVEAKKDLTARLQADPLYYDVQLAGWWLWGINAWIGGAFCSGRGAWQARGGYGKNNNKNRERIWFSPYCLQPNNLFCEKP